MAKTAYKLDTRRAKADGKYPLKISLSHKGKTVYIPTSTSFTTDEWADILDTLNSRRRRGREEAVIEQMKLQMDAALVWLGERYNLDGLDVDSIRDKVLSRIRDGVADVTDGTDEEKSGLFVPFYTEEMNSKSTAGTRLVYKDTLRLVRLYEEACGRKVEKLTFADITPEWLRGFDAWISGTNGPASRHKHERNIRCVFNAAIEDGVAGSATPFSKNRRRVRSSKYSLPVIPPTRKRDLTLEELVRLRDFPCAPYQVMYKDIFMLMFYLIGVNAADLFTAKPSQVVGGRFEYVRQKTGVFYSIKIEPEARAILRKYRGKRLLLEPCEHYKRYEDFLHHMNDALKKIGYVYNTRESRTGTPLFPELSTYWTRYSWSSIAFNHNYHFRDLIGKGLGHSWARDKVTDIYLNMDRKLVDEVNREVLDIVRDFGK